MNQVRLDTNWVDYTIVLTYFAVVLGVGFAAKRYIKSSLDYFLSGRSLPAWITGLAFISANLGATEVLGMAANGATLHDCSAAADAGIAPWNDREAIRSDREYYIRHGDDAAASHELVGRFSRRLDRRDEGDRA